LATGTMVERFRKALKHGWNAFTNPSSYKDPSEGATNFGYARPDRARLTFSNERSIIAAIYTRLAIDVSSIQVRHVRLDGNKRYIDDIDSGLNNCLTVETNLDQAAQAFRQDVVMTLFDKGVAAIVPVDTTIDPSVSGSFDVQTMRVGEVVAWHPRHVRVNVYDETKGYRRQITLEKKYVAIIENPLYSVMNEPNSTLQRLIRKLNLLDAVDEQSSSGKLDLIIQLPYVIKSEARRTQANQRRADIEAQLKGSQYGIAYTDGTEKVTQLNRPAENNLLAQIEYLTALLYSQLGLTVEVMNGTADEKTMINYHNRTIKPILDAVVEAMIRSFLTKTGRSQGQSIMYFRNVLALVPAENLAMIADKFSRNEILTSNEFRSVLGYRPSTDPNADKLRNSNMPAVPKGAPGSQVSPAAPSGPSPQDPPTATKGDSQNGSS
jgi:hypothetical protein